MFVVYLGPQIPAEQSRFCLFCSVRSSVSCCPWLLFPEPLEVDTDLKLHFYANHGWFFTLGAMLPLIDAVDTLLKGHEHFLAQGSLYVVTIALVFVLNLVAARGKHEVFHRFFAVFFLAYLLAFIGINLRVLE